MSCLNSSVVFQIRVGEIISHPLRIRRYDLSDPNATLSGFIVDPDNVLVDSLSFDILDQEINPGVALMIIDARSWDTSLSGLTLKFDVVLEIVNTVAPPTVYATPLMYLEVVPSPTLSQP